MDVSEPRYLLCSLHLGYKSTLEALYRVKDALPSAWKEYISFRGTWDHAVKRIVY